jgi:hypothetical protein
MSRTSLKRRAGMVPEPAVSSAPLPSRDEFQADCEALTSAVMRTLEAKAEAPTGPGPAVAKAGLKPIHYPRAMEFVPPYSFIMAHVSSDRNGGKSPDQLTISRRLLEFLLRCALDHIDFDEQQYLACNPDVADAVKQRKMYSGREHFIKTGYFEGRSGGVRVDEAWYLARNPDVAAAKRAGKFDSGVDQYRLAGASEWRVPNSQSEDTITMWKSVLER